MTSDDFIAHFARHGAVPSLTEALARPASKVRLRGGAGSATAFVAAAVAKESQRDHLFILPDKESASYFLSDLELLVGRKKVLFFPQSYRRPYEEEETDNANVIQRGEVLNRISSGTTGQLIVTYGAALAEKVVSRRLLKQHSFTVTVGESVQLDFVNDMLHEYGFDRVDQVYEPGQFAIRGGIIDIFSYAHEMPVRIELFGDDVESIRYFDPAEQLSVRSLQRATIVPNVQSDMMLQERVSLIDYLPGTTVVWLKDMESLRAQLRKELKDALDAFAQLHTDTRQSPPSEKYTSPEDFMTTLGARTVVGFGTGSAYADEVEVALEQSPQPAFNKDFKLLQSNLEGWRDKGYTTVLLTDNPQQSERLHQIFEDLIQSGAGGTGGGLFTPIVLSIHEGFIDHDLKLVCYTDHQIFERFHRYKLRNAYKRGKESLTIKELTGLMPGDFVTHIDHGVGRFAGLEKIDVNGKMQEAVRLVYQDGDILYVSIHSLHRIAKYSGKEGAEPRINKLGTQAWKTLKAKTKGKVKDIAKDLIRLYAQRKAQKGFSFTPDSYLQAELEASFIYIDTPDQEKATEAVKADMKRDWPMDRLVCGDVGFGKTEVAVRAAFKAVCDGKQVAVLVPTTILALQHYKTFRDRLKDFPARVDYLNRFKSAKEQKETLEKLENGEIDIIIGTHAIVGKGVKFHDLGLLIIDEEQKFGVAVKDRLKQFKVNVDTLTLTATPIPRTLQFSLMGARDLSVINTPPPNRHPIITEVVTFSEETIRDAIMYEVQRGGQVFFVHNRVDSIKEVAGMIGRLCPDVRVCTGHGQMEPHKLEEVMLRFIEGEYDVLVATTIIESGLDIPNANTIIINNAQHFGLSDLHQMRGRVGRSNRKAFCYLIAPPISSLTTEGRKRMQAISEYSELGSGFNIAMRDLDIRGAGNLLGGEQSGFISDIGYEMYQKILDEAMQELRHTDEFKHLFADQPQGDFVDDCQIDTDLEILLPDSYVNSIAERLRLYKELDDLEDDEALEGFANKLRDRFGPLPPQAEELIHAVRLRRLAKHIGFEKLILKNGRLVGHFLPDEQNGYFQSAQFGRVLEYVQMNPTEVTLKQKNDRLSLSIEGIRTVRRAEQALGPLVMEEVV
jgi:transcription-repair coupling factor (superfamily II helicase)